jgi:hypothetical protein
MPVLLLFFNRKKSLIDIFSALKKYKPKKVYLASDGARNYIQGEAEKVSEIREYALNSIDWECEVKTLFREGNLGCKDAVHEAVQWFFSHEEKGIILEDDIVPSLNFFKFCEEALERFKEDKNISSIGGRNELGYFDGGQGDVIFSSKFFCWGWASWSDRVLGLDVGISSSLKVKKQLINSVGFYEKQLVKGMYGLLESHQVNSWAYQYDINFRARGQLQILPTINMIKNVGLAIPGTHSSGKSEDLVERFDEFGPKIYLNVDTVKNEEFIRQYILFCYKNILNLFLFSKIKHLKTIRILLRKMR